MTKIKKVIQVFALMLCLCAFLFPVTVYAQAIGDTQPAPEIADFAEEESIPDNIAVFTPGGGGTVQDNATDEDGKEFFTVTTEDGSVYYLIIDRQRGTENVYLLSPVTEKDLLGLAGSGEDEEQDKTEPKPEQKAPSPAEQKEVSSAPVQKPPAKSSAPSKGTIIFILLAVCAIGAAGYYIKIVKPRKEATQRDDYEYEDDDDYADAETEFLFEDEETAAGSPNGKDEL